MLWLKTHLLCAHPEASEMVDEVKNVRAGERVSQKNGGEDRV